MEISENNAKSSNDENTHIRNQDYFIEKLPKPVYYVESPNDDTVLVGMDVTIFHDKIGDKVATSVSWYDTSHERIMAAAEIERKNDDFTFQRAECEGGGSYYFTPMNLEIYNSKVKHRLAAGGDFANEEDLIKAFLETLEGEV